MSSFKSSKTKKNDYNHTLDIESNSASKKSEALCLDFATFEETMLTEVVVDYLLDYLDQIKISVNNFKDNCQVFREIYPQIYRVKKSLISKYVKCLNEV